MHKNGEDQLSPREYEEMIDFMRVDQMMSLHEPDNCTAERRYLVYPIRIGEYPCLQKESE